MDNTTVPENLIEMLVARGAYEESVLSEIKIAYEQCDQARVFVLVGKLLNEGPGTLPKSDK